MSAIRKEEQDMLPRSNQFQENDIFKLTEKYQFGELHFKEDNKTGLKSIIAIHSTKLGPSLGGCRFIEYPSTQAALHDVMRLAQAMSYKAAICGLELGGGKAVILKPPHVEDHQAFFESFGEFVNDLGGRYITAMDAGTFEEDMNIIARKTSFIASHSQPGGISGNPAPYTARGVLEGMRASVKHHFKTDDFSNIHVVIQGVGQVGYYLAKFLHERGAKLSVCDVNEIAVNRCVEEFSTNIISLDDAIATQCDILAPCALGGIINDKTVDLIKAKVIAGCANNQLEHPEIAHRLLQKGISYAPDFLINAGGLIHAASIYFGKSEEKTLEKIGEIYPRMLDIFQRSEQEQRGTNEIVIEIAKEIVGK